MEEKTLSVFTHLKLTRLGLEIDLKGRELVEEADTLMQKFVDSGKQDTKSWIEANRLLAKAEGLALAQALIMRELDENKIEM